MEVTCISDLHGQYPQLEGGDLLIVAGDLTANGEYCSYIEFCQWLEECEYEEKIVIAGNHDNGLVPGYKGVEFGYDFSGWATYLCDSGTEFEGLKIWGSPWTLRFPGMNSHCMAFTVDTEEELAEKFRLIPDDIDILVTHSPPYEILDELCEEGKHAGSTALLNYMHYRNNKVKLHVFGHVHESYGHRKIIGRDEKTIHLVNASHVNERYEPVNKPVRIVL